MLWVALRPDKTCPVWEIMPWIDRTIQLGHREGLACKCQPCLDDTVLVHHELVEGKPVQCSEPGAHECQLRGM
jgi:hypothetical protein